MWCSVDVAAAVRWFDVGGGGGVDGDGVVVVLSEAVPASTISMLRPSRLAIGPPIRLNPFDEELCRHERKKKN